MRTLTRLVAAAVTTAALVAPATMPAAHALTPTVIVTETSEFKYNLADDATAVGGTVLVIQHRFTPGEVFTFTHAGNSQPVPVMRQIDAADVSVITVPRTTTVGETWTLSGSNAGVIGDIFVV